MQKTDSNDELLRELLSVNIKIQARLATLMVIQSEILAHLTEDDSQSVINHYRTKYQTFLDDYPDDCD